MSINEWRNGVFTKIDALENELGDLQQRYRSLVRHRQWEDAGKVHGLELAAEAKRDELLASLPENRYAQA